MPERSVSVGLRANVAGFVAGIKTAQASVSGFTRDLEKNAARKQALLGVGNAAGLMGAAAAAGVGVAIKAAADFDKSMSSVEAATRGSAKTMDLLREAALKAGADTAFSATEAAAGIENLAKAGVSTNDILRGGLTGALDLAAAGQIDVATAAESAATAMTQFGLSGADVPHVADLLAAAAGKAQGEVTDFSMALNQSGLVANQTGLSIEETTAALAAFASQGLIGSDAGTSLKTMLQSLTPSSTKAAELMKELGISAYDSRGNFIGLAEYAGVLRDGLSDMSNEQRNAAMKTIFGSDAVRAATVLYEQGAGGVERWTRRVNDTGFAAETAATKMDNLAGDLEELKGSLETALIGTGSGAQGPLRGLTQGATDAVNAFNDLPQAVKTSTLAFGGLVAVTGGATFLGARFIAAIVDGRTALRDLGLEAGRAKGALRGVGIGLAIGAAIVGLDLLADKIRDVRDMDLDAGTLDRELKLLGRTGEVTGQSLDTMGGDLDKFVTDVEIASAGFASATDKFVPDFLQSNFAAARDNIEKLDTAFANMVQGGDIQGARDAFRQLSTAWVAQGGSVTELVKLFPNYRGELKLAGTQAGQSAGATRRHAGAARDDADAVDAETQAILDNIAAHNRRANRLLASIDAEVGWEQAAADARKEAGRGARTLNTNTQAGRDNILALTGMANAWNELPDKTKRAEGGIKSARQEFIRIARQMGADREEARKLANELLDIPNPKRKVEVDTSEARNEVSDFVKDLASKLTGIRDEDVRITLASSAESILNTARGMNIFSNSGGAGRRPPGGIGGAGGPAVRPRVASTGVNQSIAATEAVSDATADRIGAVLSQKLNAAVKKMGVMGKAGSVLPRGSYSIGMPYLGYPGHYGADYPAATGTPVFALGAGSVAQAQSLTTSYGRHVFLNHPGGVQTRYAHMNSLLVNTGQPVAPGQQIGTVGSTGNSTGPHLHFEYLRGGSPLNPASLGIFDNSVGKIKPGWNWMYNGTGRDEYLKRHYGGPSAGSGSGGSRPMRLEGRMQIANWATGEVYFRGIARDEVDGAAEYDARIGRMR